MGAGWTWKPQGSGPQGTVVNWVVVVYVTVVCVCVVELLWVNVVVVWPETVCREKCV